MTANQSSGRRSQRVATRRQLRSQLFVRSTGQRVRASGSRSFGRRRLPRRMVGTPGSTGSPRGRRRSLIMGSIPRWRSWRRNSAPSYPRSAHSSLGLRPQARSSSTNASRCRRSFSLPGPMRIANGAPAASSARWKRLPERPRSERPIVSPPFSHPPARRPRSPATSPPIPPARSAPACARAGAPTHPRAATRGSDASRSAPTATPPPRRQLLPGHRIAQGVQDPLQTGAVVVSAPARVAEATLHLRDQRLHLHPQAIGHPPGTRSRCHHPSSSTMTADVFATRRLVPSFR